MKNKSLIFGLIVVAAIAGVIYVGMQTPKKQGYEVKSYSSDELGIKFTYVTNPNLNPELDKLYFADLAVKENSDPNVIELSSKSEERSDPGLWIQVFEKNPDLTLEQTIKEKFLAGYNSNDCLVRSPVAVEGKPQVKVQGIPDVPGYVSAEIILPPDLSDPDLLKLDDAIAKCPKEYTAVMALKFFLMNKDIPNKFIFVSAGQDYGPQFWSPSIRIVK